MTQLRRYYIAITRPGCVPIKKVPKQSYAGAVSMIQTLMNTYPRASVMLIEVLPSDVWLTSGIEVLALAKEHGIADKEPRP